MNNDTLNSIQSTIQCFTIVGDHLKTSSPIDLQNLFETLENVLLNDVKNHLYNGIPKNEYSPEKIRLEGKRIQNMLPQENKFDRLKNSILEICNKVILKRADRIFDSKFLVVKEIYEKKHEKALNLAVSFIKLHDGANHHALKESLVFFLQKDPSLASELAIECSDSSITKIQNLVPLAYSELLHTYPDLARKILEHCQNKEDVYHMDLVSKLNKLKSPSPSYHFLNPNSENSLIKI